MKDESERNFEGTGYTEIVPFTRLGDPTRHPYKIEEGGAQKATGYSKRVPFTRLGDPTRHPYKIEEDDAKSGRVARKKLYRPHGSVNWSKLKGKRMLYWQG